MLMTWKRLSVWRFWGIDDDTQRFVEEGDLDFDDIEGEQVYVDDFEKEYLLLMILKENFTLKILRSLNIE